jgi:HTH-type transcriptional regulator, transcriptional repressor of NAD biosynthesis genes
MEEQLEHGSRDIIKIVLYGPESTGKTTMAKALAAHFDTSWVPEFSRDYLQEKWNREQKICEKVDIMPIARGQMALEKEGLKTANRVLFCDTNLLETVVYSKAYFDDYCDPRLLKQALNAQYDLYFLTYIDVPWVEDDLRDRPHQRELMFSAFKKTLEEYDLPYHLLEGDFNRRFNEAVEVIEELIKTKEIGL